MVAVGTDVDSVEKFYAVCADNVLGIELFQVGQEKVDKVEKSVPPNLKPVPGTLQVLDFTSTKPGSINTLKFSCNCVYTCFCKAENHTLLK